MPEKGAKGSSRSCSNPGKSRQSLVAGEQFRATAVGHRTSLELSYVNRDTIVIGGSMGCIEPLQFLLRSLPADLPAAVAVVVHVASNSIGIIKTIASGVTQFEVKLAESGDRFAKGRIFVAPADTHLLISGDVLLLGRGPRENLARPAIDPLFRSAALERGPRSIGVILSGMLNDGASGLATIKTAGGIALVQSPIEAAAGEMPSAALETTAVDLVGTIDQIASALVRYTHEPAGPALPLPSEARMEVEIAKGSKSHQMDLAPLGRAVPLSCPACGGVLSEVKQEEPLRFRCQVGHAYTGASLLEVHEPVDEAIRVALRIIEERIVLVERMRRDAALANRHGAKELYAHRASEYRAYADNLRDVIVHRMKGPRSLP
jgi:two-component system, chemotaxis family, protein-glutamate methylesterase/glutaminase